MKKKLIAAVLAVVLVFGLSITASAAGISTNSTISAAGTRTGDPAQVTALLAEVTANRAEILSIKSNNLALSSQLKTALAALKASGAEVPEETLTQLAALKDDLKAVREQLDATRGEIEALMDTFRQYRKAKDFENAAATLTQVISVQETRISLFTQIGSLTQQMLDLVSGIQ